MIPTLYLTSLCRTKRQAAADFPYCTLLLFCETTASRRTATTRAKPPGRPIAIHGLVAEKKTHVSDFSENASLERSSKHQLDIDK